MNPLTQIVHQETTQGLCMWFLVV